MTPHAAPSAPAVPWQTKCTSVGEGSGTDADTDTVSGYHAASVLLTLSSMSRLRTVVSSTAIVAVLAFGFGSWFVMTPREEERKVLVKVTRPYYITERMIIDLCYLCMVDDTYDYDLICI